MHVAHIITRLIIGGAQENTLHTCEDQHRLHGDRVTLICGPGLGPEGSLIDRAQRCGYELHVIDSLRRNLHPWRDWQSWRAIVRLLRQIQPDLIHTHSSKAGILGRAAAHKLGIPTVHTIHGASFHYGQRRSVQTCYRAVERWAARRTAHFISVADAMSAEYLAAGIGSSEQFTTVYSGFDVGPYRSPPEDPSIIRERLGFTPHDRVVGKIARLFSLKGHEFLIEAAPEIVRRHPNVKFLFVGDGTLRDRHERRIAELRLTDRFVFAGLVEPGEVSRYVHAMDVVVHTSQWEGLARVLPQALIAGKPVVSYDVGGAAEVVRPGETGFLVPRDSVRELADAVSRLIADDALRERMGRTGRELFSEQFSHEFMTERIRDVYRDVLKSRR